MIALLLAVACSPLPTCADNGGVAPCATPTPVVQADCAGCATNPPALVRVYARADDSASWTWHVDLPYVPAFDDGTTAWAAFTPVVDQGWPVQRVVPDGTERTLVDVTVKAVNAAGVEGAPSNVIQVCMPPICRRPGPCS